VLRAHALFLRAEALGGCARWHRQVVAGPRSPPRAVGAALANDAGNATGGSMQARDVMTPKPITRNTTSSLADVMETMLDKDIRHLPIVSGDELVGMISDRDMRQFSRDLIMGNGRAKAQLAAPIADMMSGDVLTAEPEDDVDDLIEIMVEHKVGAVPIVDGDGLLVGIVSYTDILRAASGKL
jgi:CBS domain-containing protein